MSHLPDPITQPAFYESVPAKRLLAWIFDAVFVLLICLVLIPFTGFLALFFLPALWLIVGFAYRTLTLSAHSATWGMRVAAIELRNSAGQRLNFPEAALHTLGYTISIGSLFLQAISVVFMCGSLRGQSLTDMFLGTVMINRKARDWSA